MPVTTPKQLDVCAHTRESLTEAGYTAGDMLTHADIREALSLMAAEGERLIANAQNLASRLDEADEEAQLDAEDALKS